MGLGSKIFRALGILSSEGAGGIRSRLKMLLVTIAERRRYRRWAYLQAQASAEHSDAIIRAGREMPRRPLISVILPVYNIEEELLRKCIDSVRRQTYENWQLCIADDFSPSPHVRRVIEEYASRDSRITAVFRKENGHISAASNSALEPVKGEFTALLDHDDELSPDALFWVAREIAASPDADLFYSDEDKIGPDGDRFDPAFKPDWSRDLFYSLNLLTHLSVFRTDILRQIGGFRRGFEGSQDYDLSLRFIERIDERKIRHIPRVLYHWRVIPGSVAMAAGEKPYAHENARRALRSHFDRLGIAAEVTETVNSLHRVRYQIPASSRIRIIVFGEGNWPDSIASQSTGGLQTEFIRCKGYFWEPENINDLRPHDIYCFVNAGLRPANAQWLEELAGFAAVEQIGCVGGKVLGASGETLAGGIVFAQGRAATAHYGFPSNANGNIFRNKVISNFSAVAAAVFAIRGDLLRESGLPDLSDIFGISEMCLRLRDNGFRIVHTPYAAFIAGRSFRRRVKAMIPFRNVDDPFLNPNLDIAGGNLLPDA